MHMVHVPEGTGVVPEQSNEVRGRSVGMFDGMHGGDRQRIHMPDVGAVYEYDGVWKLLLFETDRCGWQSARHMQ